MLCVFNKAYIGLFDRSLLPMSLIQVELVIVIGLSAVQFRE